MVPKVNKNKQPIEGEFEERIKKMDFSELIMKGIPINLREIIYPIIIQCKFDCDLAD